MHFTIDVNLCPIRTHLDFALVPVYMNSCLLASWLNRFSFHDSAYKLHIQLRRAIFISDLVLLLLVGKAHRLISCMSKIFRNVIFSKSQKSTPRITQGLGGIGVYRVGYREDGRMVKSSRGALSSQNAFTGTK